MNKELLDRLNIALGEYTLAIICIDSNRACEVDQLRYELQRYIDENN